MAKKYFLVLLAGPPDPGFSMPNALGEDGQSVVGGGPSEARRHGAARNEGRTTRPKKRSKGSKGIGKAKGYDWVMQKKESQRRAGKEVRNDSKYTARRRTGQMKF